LTNYSAYGLVFSSEIPLEGFEPSSDPPTTRVTIGDTPRNLIAPVASGPSWEVSPGCVLLRVGNVGRFLISNGGEVIITPLSEGTAAELSFVLLHGIVSILLHQRGIPQLHASAIQMNGHAIAVAGHGGAGKSTLLLEFARRGGRIVTDDIAALAIDRSGAVLVQRGFPRAHVWPETLNYFGMGTEGLKQVRSKFQKYQVPGTAAEVRSQLGAVVCIDVRSRGDLTCERLQGRAAFSVLRSHVRARRFAEALDRGAVFESVAKVADRVPTFRIIRPETGPPSVRRIADDILALSS